MKPVFCFLFKKEQTSKMLFSVFVISILFLLTFVTAFQNYEKQPIYSEVRIFINTLEQVKQLAQQGLILTEARNEKNSIVTVLIDTEMEILIKSGIPHEVLVEDVVAEFNSRPKMSKEELGSLERQMKDTYGIEGFGFGSMAGFYTWPEIISKMDSMHLQYPNLTTAKQSIGTTIEGRSIYAMKISVNPEIDDPSKPEVLYTAMIHAREPQAMMTVMYYMYYLLENYGTNDEVTYLLDHRQIWFIPCCNPDGYEYNRTTNPGGSGMFRTNRRPTSASPYGIDLNRNWGVWRYWNSSNGGSSSAPTTSQTYRGTEPFSEPETQAIRDFCNAHQFKTALNYHTYSNLLIYPWAWIDPTPTPDSAYFNYYSNTMVQWNGYEPGTATTTVGYSVRGSSDDWMYGDTTGLHPKILAMTPEVGPSFWPSQAEIFPLAQENLKPNLFYSLVAGPYAEIIDTSFNHPAFLPGDSGIYRLTVRNIGVVSSAGFEYKFSSESPYVTIPNDTGNWAMTAFLQKDSAKIKFYLNESIPAGNNISCTLKFYQNGILQKSIPIVIKINQANILTSAPDTLKFIIVQSAGDSLDEMSFYIKNTGMGTLNYSMNGSTMLVDRIMTNQNISESYTEDKCTNPGGNGVRQTEGSGGPDACGYKWEDSDAPGGPVYVWNDISGTGTLATTWTSTGSYGAKDEGYSGPYNLGFNFKFYDQIYSVVYISSNGFLMFSQPTADSYTNATIPSSSSPNGYIAGFWDDLDGTNQGTVHYQQIGNKFVVQFTNWPQFYGTNGNTFQIVINFGGKIDFYYHNMTGTLNSSTVGIENSAGSIGLQCVYNAAYVHSNMAIRFSRLPEWLSVTPTSGTINPNDSVLITAKASSQGFEDFGIFYGSVVIQSNDLLHNPLTLPAVLKYQSTVSAGDPGRSNPHVFALKQNYPNPFNPSTTISFELPSNGKAELAVYNTLGQKVRTLLTGYQTAGLKTAVWDGKNDQGKAVGSGIYLYRLTSGSFTQTRKMMLLK